MEPSIHPSIHALYLLYPKLWSYVISGSKRCFDKQHGTQSHFSLRCYACAPSVVSISVTGLTGAAGFSASLSSYRGCPIFVFLYLDCFIWCQTQMFVMLEEKGCRAFWSGLGPTPAGDSRPTHLRDLRGIQLITHLGLVPERIQLPSEEPGQHRVCVSVTWRGIKSSE